jgi:hypothetical protein
MNNLTIYIDNFFKEIKIINDNIINKESNLYNIEEIYKKIKNYEDNLKYLKNMIKSIESLIQNIKSIYNYKLLKIKTVLYEKQKESINEKYNIEYKNITNNKEYENKSYMKCPIISISQNNLDLIINTPIYHIKETNEYCIKINNKIIKGNIGNIISESEINKKKGTKIKHCSKINCDKVFYNKECLFYHKGDIRNFPIYSWKYINKNKLGKIKVNNKKFKNDNYDLENSRFIGSLNTLNIDLQFTTKKEKKLRKKQLMHDILLYQILDQYLNE